MSMDEAQALSKEGHDANAAGDTAKAKRLFLQAHELAPSAVHLFSAANMCLKLGEIEEARTHYSYLAGVPLDETMTKRLAEKLADPRLALPVSAEYRGLMQRLFTVLTTDAGWMPDAVLAGTAVVVERQVRLCMRALAEGVDAIADSKERAAMRAFVRVLQRVDQLEPVPRLSAPLVHAGPALGTARVTPVSFQRVRSGSTSTSQAHG